MPWNGLSNTPMPSDELLNSTVQDKYAQKLHFEAHGVPVAPFADVADLAGLTAAAGAYGYPFMLKSKR